ncbi:hypothetical protein HY358_01230 [Candidatus Roizmanbacteria bacterium]|nr:hypothetical protein [Candidatus Roizmanbacteria bacterium]
MLKIQPIDESAANDSVKDCYRQLKKTFRLPHLPLFFTYLGSFPEYLQYLTKQIVSTVDNTVFSGLIQEKGLTIEKQLRTHLHPSDDFTRWLQRNQYSPSFYNFQNDLKHIFETNLKLAFIFLALREAVKGWAVATKKLSTTANATHREVEQRLNENSFVYNTIQYVIPNSFRDPRILDSRFRRNDNGKMLKRVQHDSIEKDLLPEYLQLSRNEFAQALKTQEFLETRVVIEKDILNSLDLLPNFIVSPLNVVLQYTAKYSNFPELLYLLSEHFPTHAVQRMLFSGFMLQK